jgi:hypothetical protein
LRSFGLDLWLMREVGQPLGQIGDDEESAHADRDFWLKSALETRTRAAQIVALKTASVKLVGRKKP